MFLYTRILEAFPRLKQRVFLALYQYLARYDHVSWTFMNYGHAPEMGRPLRLLTEDEADRYCIQLYEKVTSGVSLHGKAILEVGSGRGGGLSYLHRYRRPASSRGVDLSPLAVNFCNERHRRTGDDLWFRTGDALALPYNEATFDVVVNVESSHCYPSRLAFFHEACRVLKPGGYFCFADLHEAYEDVAMYDWLQEAGFAIAEREDLTPGVLRALKLDDARKRTMINQLCPWILRRPVSAFAAVVGSRTYTSFVLGARQYTRWLAVKR
jgi:SAM-dependent methyltransferase